jgi:hypothetical protein
MATQRPYLKPAISALSAGYKLIVDHATHGMKSIDWAALQAQMLSFVGGLIQGSILAVNVKTYGALGDGVADDTDAIINAFAASSKVDFPAGTYKITSTIVLPNSAALIGAAPGRTVLEIYCPVAFSTLVESRSVSISNCTIANMCGAAGLLGIELVQSRHARIRNVEVLDYSAAGSVAIKLDGKDTFCASNVIDSVQLGRNYIGIDLTADSGSQTNHTSIVNCYIYGSYALKSVAGSTGVRIARGDTNYLDGTAIEDYDIGLDVQSTDAGGQYFGYLRIENCNTNKLLNPSASKLVFGYTPDGDMDETTFGGSGDQGSYFGSLPYFRLNNTYLTNGAYLRFKDSGGSRMGLIGVTNTDNLEIKTPTFNPAKAIDIVCRADGTKLASFSKDSIALLRPVTVSRTASPGAGINQVLFAEANYSATPGETAFASYSRFIHSGSATPSGGEHLVGSLGRAGDTASGKFTMYGHESRVDAAGSASEYGAALSFANFGGASFAGSLIGHSIRSEVYTDGTYTTPLANGANLGLKINKLVGGSVQRSIVAYDETQIHAPISSWDNTGTFKTSIAHDGDSGTLASSAGHLKLSPASGSYIFQTTGLGLVPLTEGLALGASGFRWAGAFTTLEANGNLSVQGGNGVRLYKPDNSAYGTVTVDSSGNLRLTAPAASGQVRVTSELNIDGPITSNRILRITTGGANRWALYADTGAESGANAGSTLAITAYTDAGGFIDSPLTIARVAGGSIGLNRPVSVSGSFSTSGTITTNGGFLYINAGVSDRHLRWNTSGSARWSWYCGNTAETGSNAGSQMALAAYSDAGAFIDTPISVARAAGGTISLNRPVAIGGYPAPATRTYTVATLPTGAQAAAERFAYCSDCITFDGAGSLVYWDFIGSFWRTIEHCRATTDPLTFWRSAAEQGLSERGAKGFISSPSQSQLGSNVASYNGGATSPASGVVETFYLDTGVTTNGQGAIRGDYLHRRNMVASGYLRIEASLMLLSDGTNTFWAEVGIGAYPGATNVTEWVGVRYDPSNALGSGGAAVWTALARAASVDTVAGSTAGAPSTDSLAKDVIEVLMLPDRFRVYVNGAQVGADLTTGLPNATNVYPGMLARITKTVGTSARHMRVSRVSTGYLTT